MYTFLVYSARTGNSVSAVAFWDVHRSEIDRLVGVAVRITLALLLVLLGGLFCLLCSLLFLLLALALGLVFIAFIVTVTTALALLALLVGDLGFRLGLIGRGKTRGGDSRSGENLRCGCGFSNRCGSAIDVVPVEVLVLGVPLGRSLVIGTAKFLDLLV
jgi:hypothetical protein